MSGSHRDAKGREIFPNTLLGVCPVISHPAPQPQPAAPDMAPQESVKAAALFKQAEASVNRRR